MPDVIRQPLPSLPVPTVSRPRRPVASLVATAVAIGAWVVLFVELGAADVVAEPLTARLADVVQRMPALPTPAAEAAPRPHRHGEARAFEASWTSRPDAPDAAAPDAGSSRPGL